MDKTYLLLNDRKAYNAALLDEIKNSKDTAARLEALNDYVKANKDNTADLKAVVAGLSAEDRAALTAAAKNDIAKTAAGQQKVAYRKQYEAKEAKETFDFFYQKEKAIYQAITGKPVDEEAVIKQAAALVAPAQTPEQLAKSEEAIKKNIADIKAEDVKAPKHNVENDKPADLIDSMAGMLASYEKTLRHRVIKDKEHAEYMAYVTDRQKAVYDILSGKETANIAALAKKMQQSR